MAGKSIEIDRKKRLRGDPDKGHNRWHLDIAPVIEAEPGAEVSMPHARGGVDAAMNALRAPAAKAA